AEGTDRAGAAAGCGAARTISALACPCVARCDRALRSSIVRPQLERNPPRRRRVLVQLPVDGRNLVDQALPVAVLEAQDLGEGPVEVVGDEGYLLEQSVEGVAYRSPGREASTANSWLHSGQVTVICSVPLVLIRR